MWTNKNNRRISYKLTSNDQFWFGFFDVSFTMRWHCARSNVIVLWWFLLSHNLNQLFVHSWLWRWLFQLLDACVFFFFFFSFVCSFSIGWRSTNFAHNLSTPSPANSYLSLQLFYELHFNLDDVVAVLFSKNCIWKRATWESDRLDIWLECMIFLYFIVVQLLLLRVDRLVMFIRFNVHISIDNSPIEIDQFQPSIELNAFGISVDVAFCSSLSSPTQWNSIQLIEMCHLHLDCCNSSWFIFYWGWLEHATKNINNLSASPNYSLKHSILIHLLNSLTGYFWLNNFDCLLIVFDVR